MPTQSRSARILLAGLLTATLAACGGPEQVRPFPTYAIGDARITAIGSGADELLQMLVTRPDKTRGLLPPLSQGERPQQMQVSPAGDLLILERYPDRGKTTAVDLRTGRSQTLAEYMPCEESSCLHDYFISPDSSHVAFYTERRGTVVLRAADGRWETVRQAPPVQQGGPLAVADDGTTLTYSPLAPQLRLQYLDGQERELQLPRLGLRESRSSLQAAFLPDRATLLVTLWSDVFLLDLRTGKIGARFAPPLAVVGYPYFSGASRSKALVGYASSSRNDFVEIDLRSRDMRTLGTVDNEWLDWIGVSASQMRAGVTITDLRRAASLTETRT